MAKKIYEKTGYINNGVTAFTTRTFGGVITALAGLCSAASLATFNATDASWFYYSSSFAAPKNILGKLGAQIAATLFYFFGLSGWCIPLLFGGIAVFAFSGKSLRSEIDRLLAGALFFPLCTTLCYAYRIGTISYMVPGGVVGQNLYFVLLQYCEPFLALLFLWVSLLCSIIILSRGAFLPFVSFIFNTLFTAIKQWRVWLLPVMRGVYYAAQLVFATAKFLGNFFITHCVGVGTSLQGPQESIFAFETHQQAGHSPAGHDFANDPFWQEYLATPFSGASRDTDFDSESAALMFEQEKAKVASTKVTSMTAPVSALKSRKEYSLPALSLFQPTVKEVDQVDKEQQKITSTTLEEKLARFGIVGTVVAIKPGPVITLYEYQPDIDAKVSKILALSDDLALALEAVSVRIIAPIPGTSRVGFEVANKKRVSVFLRDIIRSSVFQNNKSFLPVVLGKDTSGSDVIVDLVDMPHLLVAGSTGSGKSVGLNTLLVSLLYKLRPDQLKLIIVDPKRLEFCAYSDIPHLLFPIITQPQKADMALRWLVKTMEERYEKMAMEGARNIFDYKELCKKEGRVDDLPFIVVIIDELADLMMVARKDIEESIARLAQMARAAGIHLILATQRPSVDVLTGVIKVNFPSRISFRVTSKVDSRTVIDTYGAEALLGKGDMLFVDSHSSRIRRIHGAYVNDAEINAIANHVRAQQKVEYIDLQNFVQQNQRATDSGDEPLLAEVIAYLATVDEISISSLQRRFKIGYNRSARIIELLESEGRVMPADGAKLRKIIH